MMISGLRSGLQRWHGRLQVALLFALAYIPALTAHPGKMPADTKLFLYLDPARLTSDAPFSFDSRQFAGWVPHQTISYLWPSGPWYSAFSWLGVPDWIAHRLWIGTLLVLGGLGVRWAAKQLGLPAVGALIAALFYQLSPYVLPYISRTSLMLLPWAGLGWMIGLTVRAATRTRWRDVAIFGLVMFTVAAPNATAILMIAPGPVLWLLHAGWSKIISWKRALVTAARIGAVSVVTSLWWIAMLSVQGKFGADVLGYSETLQAVSLTSSSTEVLRGMGYWLFYVRDPIGFATTASFDYMSSGRLIAISFAVLGIGLLGLTCTRWVSRRFAVLLVFVGVVLAVGVHPIDESSPLLAPFAHNSRSSIALALRSSTRALPLSSLGLALGAGAFVTALAASRARRRERARTSVRWRALAPWMAGALAIANLPALFDGGFVDSNLLRDQDPPAAWDSATAALDAAPRGSRVLQLPGTEFGAFRWGYTVDPPLVGLTDEPLITRDLLPLGSPAAMDLIYALDDRFQEGTAETPEVAPIARLFGVDTIWLPNDVAFDRFRTPRPELTSAQLAGGGEGLGVATGYGEPTVNVPTIPEVDEQSISNALVGEPLPPVQLVPVQSSVPIMRAKAGASTVLVAGSGDGVVDAAAAGLVDGTQLIRYAADEIADDPAEVADAAQVILTDSNRDRAHHWRGSQDVWGFTEDGGTDSGVLRFDAGDQRTPVFPDATAADMTVAEQRGAVHAAASSYGEPAAYRPEDRAAMAVDGDVHTAWVTAERYDADREYLRLQSDQPMSTLTLVQPQDDSNRWISRIDVTDASGTYSVGLDDSSRTAAGQAIALRAASTEVTITITATAHRDLRFGEGLDAVGFAEVTTGLGPTEEVVRVPSNVLPNVGADQPLSIVLTRLRTRATNRWRGDPERSIVRSFTLPAARSFTPEIAARLDARASDATIAALLGWSGTTADRRLTGVPTMGGWAATDGDPTTSWVTPFGQAVGATLTIPLSSAGPVASLTIRQPISDQIASITEVSIAGDDPGAAPTVVPVGAPDANGDSVVDFTPITATALHITITATDDATTVDRRYAEPVLLPAGIAEISGAGIVAAQLPARIDVACSAESTAGAGLLRIDDTPVQVALTGTIDELFAGGTFTASPCNTAAIALDSGEHVVRTAVGADGGIDVDRIVLTAADAQVPTATAVAEPTVTVLDNGRTSRTMRIEACPTGCWFVFGEGYNTGWTASIAGHDLGTQTRVDGGFNGWYLPPSDQARTIEMTWQGETPLAIGLGLGLVGVLACIALIVFDRRRLDALDVAPPVLVPVFTASTAGPRFALRSRATATTVAATIVGALVIAPVWGLVCGAICLACTVGLRRPRVIGLVAVLIAGWTGLVILRRVTTLHPFVNAGWPGNFEDLHRPGMAVIVLLLATALARQPVADVATVELPASRPWMWLTGAFGRRRRRS